MISQTQPSGQKPNYRPFKSRVIFGETVTPAVARWFIKLGIVKTERSSGRLIVSLITLFFAASVYFFIIAQ